MLESFENNLKGKQKGDAFDFFLSAQDSYGEWEQGRIVEIPKDAFKNDKGIIEKDVLVAGKTVPMVDHEGNHLMGLIEEVLEQHVKMDFNHPLAGQSLHFKGSVKEIREASAEELSHGHVHGPGGHHH